MVGAADLASRAKHVAGRRVQHTVSISATEWRKRAARALFKAGSTLRVPALNLICGAATALAFFGGAGTGLFAEEVAGAWAHRQAGLFNVLTPSQWAAIIVIRRALGRFADARFRGFVENPTARIFALQA